MRNSDPLVHNVRSLSLENRAFNIAQPAATPDRKKVFKKRERAITIQCDFHPWMKAFIFVMDHPYFAVTGKKGEFTLGGLPAGKYTLAWKSLDRANEIALPRDRDRISKQANELVELTVDRAAADLRDGKITHALGLTHEIRSRDIADWRATRIARAAELISCAGQQSAAGNFDSRV